MTTLTRFVPVRSSRPDVAILQDRLNSLFQEFVRPESAGIEGASFVPAVDIYEDAQKLVLKLEVPGIRQEDLDIRVENQILTVKGERKLDSEEKQENFHRIERRFGSFIRTFTLPQTIDTEAVSANYDAGVLNITLARKAEAKAKQIKVQFGAAPQAKPVVEGANQ